MGYEILGTVRIARADIPVYRQLGAVVRQKGTNGYWVDLVFDDARTVAHLLDILTPMSFYESCSRVARVGSAIIGAWYRGVVGDADYVARGARRGGAKRSAEHLLTQEVRIDLYVILARIAEQVLTLGDDIRVHPHGLVEGNVDGEWVKVDRELVDACAVDEDLTGGDRHDAYHKLVARIRAYWAQPTATPEELREIIRRTNGGAIDKSGECLAVAPAARKGL